MTDCQKIEVLNKLATYIEDLSKKNVVWVMQSNTLAICYMLFACLQSMIVLSVMTIQLSNISANLLLESLLHEYVLSSPMSRTLRCDA